MTTGGTNTCIQAAYFWLKPWTLLVVVYGLQTAGTHTGHRKTRTALISVTPRGLNFTAGPSEIYFRIQLLQFFRIFLMKNIVPTDTSETPCRYLELDSWHWSLSSIYVMFHHLHKRICNIVDQQGVMSINGHLNLYQIIKT